MGAVTKITGFSGTNLSKICNPRIKEIEHQVKKEEGTNEEVFFEVERWLSSMLFINLCCLYQFDLDK